jgi:hypothetical protein
MNWIKQMVVYRFLPPYNFGDVIGASNVPVFTRGVTTGGKK